MSDVAARRISAAVPKLGEVLVVPNGIDPTQWAVEPRGYDPSRLRVTSVMRMAPRKRTMPLVRIIMAATEASAPGVDVRAVLVGDGPERARAEKHVRDRGMGDRIRFTGRLDRAGILEVFAESDVYLQPSVRE
ncbi:MAG: glycosyltransferase [Actinobacteria bacterium]|nr:glycosyltransferase [Actinomycetota bacterium]